jgi:hypothetical protein
MEELLRELTTVGRAMVEAGHQGYARSGIQWYAVPHEELVRFKAVLRRAERELSGGGTEL